MKEMLDKYCLYIDDSTIKFNEDFVGIKSSEEFNVVCDHIYTLLKDAFLLLSKGSYNTSIFLTISVIEECAKAEIGLYRSKSGEKVKRGKDPMFSHEKKQFTAASPTVQIGNRLFISLGEDIVNEIIGDLRKGRYKNIREDAIYFKRDANKLTVPSDKINKEHARNLLLVAIEILDDRLIGYTKYTFKLSEKLDEMYKQVEKV